MPCAETVATAVFEEAHDAVAVTSFWEPSENWATADSCTVRPGINGINPATVTDVSVRVVGAVGDVGEVGVVVLRESSPHPLRTVPATHTHASFSRDACTE
jgi:hypothetical protein